MIAMRSEDIGAMKPPATSNGSVSSLRAANRREVHVCSLSGVSSLRVIRFVVLVCALKIPPVRGLGKRSERRSARRSTPLARGAAYGMNPTPVHPPKSYSKQEAGQLNTGRPPTVLKRG